MKKRLMTVMITAGLLSCATMSWGAAANWSRELGTAAANYEGFVEFERSTEFNRMNKSETAPARIKAEIEKAYKAWISSNKTAFLQSTLGISSSAVGAPSTQVGLLTSEKAIRDHLLGESSAPLIEHGSEALLKGIGHAVHAKTEEALGAVGDRTHAEHLARSYLGIEGSDAAYGSLPEHEHTRRSVMRALVHNNQTRGALIEHESEPLLKEAGAHAARSLSDPRTHMVRAFLGASNLAQNLRDGSDASHHETRQAIIHELEEGSLVLGWHGLKGNDPTQNGNQGDGVWHEIVVASAHGGLGDIQSILASWFNIPANAPVEGSLVIP